MINTLISDLGGVFLNKGLRSFWEYLEKEYGIEFERSKSIFLNHYDEYFSGKINEKNFLTTVFKELSLDTDWKLLRKILLNSYKVQDGMPDLIDAIRTKGIKTVLLSDQTKEWWPYLDKKFDISRHFDYVVISAEVGFHKPDKKIYEYALNHSGSKPNQSIFIDDRLENLLPAEKLGMSTYLFEDVDNFKKELIKRNILF